MVVLKKLNAEFPYDPAILLLGIYLKKKKKNENTNLKRLVHHEVRSSTSYNSQDYGSKPKGPFQTMNKKYVIYKYRYIHNRIFFSNKNN